MSQVIGHVQPQGAGFTLYGGFDREAGETKHIAQVASLDFLPTSRPDLGAIDKGDQARMEAMLLGRLERPAALKRRHALHPVEDFICVEAGRQFERGV